MEYDNDNYLANNTAQKIYNKFGGGDETPRDDGEDSIEEKMIDSSDNEEEKQETEESDDEEIDEDEEQDIEDEEEKLVKKQAKKPVVADIQVSDSDEEDDDEDDDEDYLKKFDKELRKNYIVDSHPEVLTYNYSEIQALAKVVRDPKTGIIIDEFHKTIPILTKYEKTRILGQRAKQINSGAKPYIPVNPKYENDGYTIALKELSLKKLPFIIRRPLPNGASEFWKLEDLQILYT